MRTYLKIQFHSEGAPPSEVIAKLEKLGWKPIRGEYDFVMEGGLGEGLGESFRDMIDKLHNTLGGTDVRYSICSFS
ncbi:MAG: hypothetical protein AYK23_04880 [Candidatus Proteinoplasmatales archaeon SG8-5]|nr:MAG: hypothetical protein AYK23_04880 [Candidatus Proteinoplasmatales archaeon SG8-5]